MITTVTIIEDDRVFSTTLSKIINSNELISCMAIYHNAKTALQEFPNNPTDIILMDIQLPDDSGIKLTAHFKKQFPNTFIIMCTNFDDDEKVFDSLKAGANGFIIKLENPEKISEYILEVMLGGAPMTMGIAKKVIQYFSKQESEKIKLEALTLKENELLALLSTGNYYKEIAEKMNISLNTVKKHCGNIYHKLHVNNRTEAINLLKGSK